MATVRFLDFKTPYVFPVRCPEPHHPHQPPFFWRADEGTYRIVRKLNRDAIVEARRIKAVNEYRQFMSRLSVRLGVIYAQ